MIDGRKYSLVMRSGVVSQVLLLPADRSSHAAVAGAERAGNDGRRALANAHHLFRQADFRGAAAAYRKVVEAKASDEAYAGLVAAC